MPLMQTLFYCLSIVSLILMTTGFVLALMLKKVAVGGTIGKAVNSIVVLIVLFLFGYVAALMIPRIGEDLALLLVGSIFLFGAAFVVLVVVLIRNLLSKVLSALDTVE